MIAVKKLIFHMPQFIGQIHMNLVGIYKTLGLVPQGIQFLFAVSLDVHYLWSFVYAGSV